jgi:integrase
MKMQEGYLTRESGAWLGHYSRWITDLATGQRKRQQRAFKIGPVSSISKTQAKIKLRERIVAESGVTADSRVTFGWFVQNRWLPLHEGSWRDSTKGVNKELLKFVTARFGTTPIEEMDGVAMQAWLADLAKKKSGSLVKHCRVFLRSILLEAAEQDYVRKNPARLLRVPKLKAVKKTYLTIEQIKALIQAARFQPRDRTLLTVLFVTALRPSELFALKWKSFDSKRSTLTIAETVYRHKIRPFSKTTQEGDTEHLTLFLPDAALIALLKWHSETERNGPEDYIFPNSKKGFITLENYQKRTLNPLAKTAEIPRVNFQIIRRSVATHAQHLGSPKDISVIMRHRKIETAQLHYVQQIQETVKQTVEALSQKMLKG